MPKHPDFVTPHPGEPGHVYETPCFHNAWHCRIHQIRVWGKYSDDPAGDAVRFPEEFYYRSSRAVKEPSNPKGWVTMIVHCGPGAWNPKRPR
jgi:hypothetical protein